MATNYKLHTYTVDETKMGEYRQWRVCRYIGKVGEGDVIYSNYSLTENWYPLLFTSNQKDALNMVCELNELSHQQEVLQMVYDDLLYKMDHPYCENCGEELPGSRVRSGFCNNNCMVSEKLIIGHKEKVY